MASRLAAAFATVALLAVGVLGGLTWATTRSEVSSLVKSRNADVARNVTAALAEAYTAGGSWTRADLHAAQMLAASNGATLQVRSRTGETSGGGGMEMGAGMMGMAATASGQLGTPQSMPVLVGGRRVGTAVLKFPLATPAAEAQVRTALGRTVVWGGLLAAGLAAAIGLLVAQRISRPLRRLTSATRAFAAGDRSVRAGGGEEPAELGELGEAFDRMAETIEREDGLRRAFAADVAHELRTPLAIAQGELEALVDGVEQPTPERLRSLHEETLRLARIVEDVESLAAAEAAQFRLDRRRLDLAEVARDAVVRAKPQAEASGLKLVTHLAPVEIDADRERLEQITGNLVGNALKFTPAGGRIIVTVAMANGDARLDVEDTGPGIANSELPHVFERFWRGRAAEAAAGSGIGLAVVAELVRAHGGHVEAASRPGGGARFTVVLPRA